MSVVMCCNFIPVSSYMSYSPIMNWSQREAAQNQWIMFQEDKDQITAPHHQQQNQADAFLLIDDNKDNNEDGTYNTDLEDERKVQCVSSSKPLREKNNRRKYLVNKHVPHKDKPPQVVAKRNARERRRVQAVNSAFLRLRNAIPIQNTRGKRVSKVKTLRNAIRYISRLQDLLQEGDGMEPFQLFSSYYSTKPNYCFDSMEDEY